jgi:hypothetical protein
MPDERPGWTRGGRWSCSRIRTDPYGIGARSPRDSSASSGPSERGGQGHTLSKPPSPHSTPERAGETDWRQIAALYDLLARVLPTPVVELNRAVALAMVEGPERGLVLLDALEASGELRGYHLLPAARADLLRRLGRVDEAREAYRAAARLATLEPERRFLDGRASSV